MIAAGYVHRDGHYEGQPNVRRFAKEMLNEDGDGDLEGMERNIRRWIDTEKPGGPSSEMRERASRILRRGGWNGQPDDLKLRPAVEALLQRRSETDAALEELTRVVGLLAQQVQELQHHVGALLREAGDLPPQP